MQTEIFGKVKDPRVMGKVKHELEDVLRIALIGVLCSCEDYDEIYDFIKEREVDLRKMGFLRLANGVPSADTVRRVVEAVDPDQMRASRTTVRDSVLKPAFISSNFAVKIGLWTKWNFTGKFFNPSRPYAREANNQVRFLPTVGITELSKIKCVRY